MLRLRARDFASVTAPMHNPLKPLPKQPNRAYTPITPNEGIGEAGDHQI
jgi:hypothetical protein